MAALTPSVSFSELVLISSFGVMLGSFGTSLVMKFNSLFQVPIVGDILNTTVVFFKNTEGVWKPVVSSALTIMKPVAEYALEVLKPFGPMALVLAENVVKGMVILGFFIVQGVIVAQRYTIETVQFIQSAGLNVTTSLQNSAIVLKDFASSLFTVMKGFSYLFVNLIKGTSYVIDSFDYVAQFMNKVFFETQSVTWNDVYDIAIPFFIVTCIMSYVVYRAYNTFVKPHSTYKKTDGDSECQQPRRSSRIARKRAMMLCADSSPLSRKESSFRTSNL